MEQVQKTPSKKKVEEVVETAPAKKTDEEIEAHKHLTDDLLDEIDSLLEDNAQEFVKNYIQKGGQ